MARSAKTSLSDQAQELRKIVELHRSELRQEMGGLRTIAVVSGKGGVGKSNVSVNLAYAMRAEGLRVVLLDADLGMANVDLLCNIVPKYNLLNVVRGEKTIEEVLVTTENGIVILPGGSGVAELADIDESQLNSLVNSMTLLEDKADYLIVDTGAGIHKGVLSFATAADTVIIVTTPEPTSVRDAYGVLKSLNHLSYNSDIRFIVNMVTSADEGLEVAKRIQMATKQFLGLPLVYLGHIMKDEKVEKAIRMRKPLLQAFPDAVASQCINNICGYILEKTGLDAPVVAAPRGIKSFILRLVRGMGAV